MAEIKVTLHNERIGTTQGQRVALLCAEHPEHYIRVKKNSKTAARFLRERIIEAGGANAKVNKSANGEFYWVEAWYEEQASPEERTNEGWFTKNKEPEEGDGRWLT